MRQELWEPQPKTIAEARAMIRANTAKAQEIDALAKATKVTNARKLVVLAEKAIRLMEENVILREKIENWR